MFFFLIKIARVGGIFRVGRVTPIKQFFYWPYAAVICKTHLLNPGNSASRLDPTVILRVGLKTLGVVFIRPLSGAYPGIAMSVRP